MTAHGGIGDIKEEKDREHSFPLWVNTKDRPYVDTERRQPSASWEDSLLGTK